MQKNNDINTSCTILILIYSGIIIERQQLYHTVISILSDFHQRFASIPKTTFKTSENNFPIFFLPGMF